MKRSAYTANSSLIETTNNHSPKRSCTLRNKLSVASACSSLSSDDMLTMEDHIQSLISMGFIDRDLNRKLLIKANNDISEAVTLLTSYNYFNDDDDDVHIPAETSTASPFISPLVSEQFEQQQQQQQAVPSDDQSDGLSTTNSQDLTINDFQSFTTNDFLELENKAYGDNWSIPYRRDEPLGRCLLSATKLALAGTTDQDKNCVRFMEELIPEVFRKLQCSHHVNTWHFDIQQGVFDMLELLIDLIAARLAYSPTPVKLLGTLAIVFDQDSVFQRKNRTKSYDRSLYEKQLGDRALANPPSSSAFSMYSRTEPHGWLCQLINRFVYKDGIVNLKERLRTDISLNASEYNALLVPFVNCLDYIFIDKYRQLFGEHIEQAIDYIQTLKDEDFKAKSTYTIFDLISTLRKISSVLWNNRIEQIEQIHLNLLLKMISLSNFNAKMNSLKELAKLIENYTSNVQTSTKAAIRREVISDWIIENSILSKALEGNIDQNQYVDKVRIIFDFIAPRILNEDIETIWKMQHGRSLVAVDHLFTLIASAAAEFNLQQLNCLIELIYNSWKKETVLIQEKLIELLGAIGREGHKESATRILEVLWDMAHEHHLSRSMLDHILYYHLRIFREGRSSYENLKRDYCLKCMTDLQRKQGWLVPAIKHLYDLLHHDSNNTFKRTDQDLVTLLVNNKHDLISALIQSLSTCQLDVWNKTGGQVTIDTLVDGRFTHEESIKNHLDLLSFLLKKGSLYLILKRSEELWDTLVTNEHVSSFDHELGLNWFITCVEDVHRDSRNALFEKRVSKLDPIHLTTKGYNCFKLYFERCNLERQNQSRGFAFSLNTSTSIANQMAEYKGVDELWNMILCVADAKLAHDATRFLLDLYYVKQPHRTRTTTAQPLYEYFLKEVYTRLHGLFNAHVVPLATENLKLCQSLKLIGELLTNTSNTTVTTEIDQQLWLQKIERLLMIIEEYIHAVEHERSPTAHITSFHSLEYQIKIVLGELGKTNGSYDLIAVHANDTLEMLRSSLAVFYKVSPFDIHISIPKTGVSSPTHSDHNSNTSHTTVLNASSNSKYLYQVHIIPGTIVYVKILATNANQVTKSINSEPVRINLLPSSSSSSSFSPASSIFADIRSNINNQSVRITPSNMMAENCKVYDVLYKLSYLNNKDINQRIRNLLNLMPSDARIHDCLDLISIPAANSSTNERRQSTENSPVDPQQAIEHVFNIHNNSLIQLLYHLEILSSRILPLSSNNGIQQSSKTFREDFLKQSGVEFLFHLLSSLNDYIHDNHQYSLVQEMIILILQLIQYLLCRNHPQQEISSIQISPLQTSNDSLNHSMDIESPSMIEHLQFEDFVEQMKQLIFLCWAAAAGNIRLHGQNLTIKEQVKLDRHALLQQINANIFTRHNSKSSFSNDSSNPNPTVQFGICVKNKSISPLDSEIAEKIIEILAYSFEKRAEFLTTFLIQPFFADFLLEILIGTSSREVRQCALRNIYRLCQIDDIRSLIHQILLKARLPLWSTSSVGIRGSNQKLLGQSIEYFDLRCLLTENLTEDQQNILQINAKQLLTDELAWLSSYTISSTSEELRTIDNLLFLGHLKFIRTLLTCENIDKNQCGQDLIHLLIDQFLFPASKRTMISTTIAEYESIDDSAPEPKCSTSESRLAAYDVLVELVQNCPANLKVIVDELINLHHRPILEKQTEWEFMPQVSPRASCGFVGLYNGGATCYMNSILQQLYMLPQISEYILSVHDDEENSSGKSRSTLFHQIQQVFGHLLESKMQYYSPQSLWKVFRLWGQEINVCEQQDAFDFFASLTDQLDEYLKSIQRDEIFHKQFGGIFCNQMICTDSCRHRYEGEEKFMALNVAVKVESLTEALNQFVKGELLDGNNAYFCAKCQEKRTTIKRLCIKKLPPLLCIQMKRFGFDWENNRALKFDDHVRFPFVLNMEPYTVEGVNKRETFSGHEDLTPKTNGNSKNSTEHKSFSRTPSFTTNTSTINYELIGIVIHSGQANAGHYYSFIKDIRNRHSTNNNQWYRFNDTSVDEIHLTEQMLEEECFGGTFRVQKDHSYEDRTRFWNAYILIYQCIEPLKLLPPPSIIPPPSSPNIHHLNKRLPRPNQRDSLSQLADLVVQSENNDLFQMKKSLIPSAVLAGVKDENFEFVKNRDTYCDDYFQFLWKIPKTLFPLSIDCSLTYEYCTRLALNFLFHTFFRTHRRLRKDHFTSWLQLLKELFLNNLPSCQMFYTFLFREKNDELLKLYLLDCPIDDIRQDFEQIVQVAFQASYIHQLENEVEMFIEQVINLLDKSVVEQVKQCQSVFQLIYHYALINEHAMEYLWKLNTLQRLIGFLLGENFDNRRWNSNQARDFAIVHELISILILHKNSNSELLTVFSASWLPRYLKEICYAFQEISSVELPKTLQIMENLAKSNEIYSEQIIRTVLQSINQAPMNDLKSLFKLLSHILFIADSFQRKRLQLAFEGTDQSTTNDGLYALIRTTIENEQRRAYQIVKFVITLSSNQICKDYFTSTILEWESAINWLKQQMQSNSSQWSPAQNLSNEDTDKRSFQRTRSAQFTLEQAQTLLQQTRPTKLNGTDKSSPTDSVTYHDNLIFAGHI